MEIIFDKIEEGYYELDSFDMSQPVVSPTDDLRRHLHCIGPFVVGVVLPIAVLSGTVRRASCVVKAVRSRGTAPVKYLVDAGCVDSKGRYDPSQHSALIELLCNKFKLTDQMEEQIECATQREGRERDIFFYGSDLRYAKEEIDETGKVQVKVMSKRFGSDEWEELAVPALPGSSRKD